MAFQIRGTNNDGLFVFHLCPLTPFLCLVQDENLTFHFGPLEPFQDLVFHFGHLESFFCLPGKHLLDL